MKNKTSPIYQSSNEVKKLVRQSIRSEKRGDFYQTDNDREIFEKLRDALRKMVSKTKEAQPCL